MMMRIEDKCKKSLKKMIVPRANWIQKGRRFRRSQQYDKQRTAVVIMN